MAFCFPFAEASQDKVRAFFFSLSDLCHPPAVLRLSRQVKSVIKNSFTSAEIFAGRVARLWEEMAGFPPARE